MNKEQIAGADHRSFQERVTCGAISLKNPLRVALGGIAALGTTVVLHPSTAEAADCTVGVNIRAVTFEDNFGKTGQGRPDIYDGPAIDKELGPATGFIVYAADKTGNTILGSVAIGGPDGKGRIRNIIRACNTIGPNGQDALEFLVFDDQNPSHKMPAVAENHFAADVVVGKEVKKKGTPVPTRIAGTATVVSTPARTPTATRTPAGTPTRVGTVTSTPTVRPTGTPEASASPASSAEPTPSATPSGGGDGGNGGDLRFYAMAGGAVILVVLGAVAGLARLRRRGP